MKFFFFFLLSLIFVKNLLAEEIKNQNKKYECLTDTRVSGLFQFKRKFLKETEFFPSKTILNFSKSYSMLTEKEIIRGKKFEAKYQFTCDKEKVSDLLVCRPIDKNNTYNIILSLETMRYRKILITNYWLNGKGNEVDYVHIANGYCYDID